jgi:asparagine synthase (glutamine-hydrolysing)
LTVTVGEGADENFAGYSLFAADALMEADPSWPTSGLSESERRSAFQEALKKSDVFRFGSVPKNVPPSTKRMLANTNIAPTLCTHTPLPFAPWTDKFSVNDQETTIAESFNGQVLSDMQNKWHPLHTSEYIWSKTIFPNMILRYLGDNIDMVDHVESRTAYLDNRVSEYANSIPPSLKMRYDPASNTLYEKHILREALKPFITEEIYNRRKHPYMGPIRYSANGPFHQVIKRLVTKENVEQLGFIDWSKVDGLAEKAFVNHEHLAYLTVLSVAQFVVFSQRFGVKRAGLF